MGSEESKDLLILEQLNTLVGKEVIINVKTFIEKVIFINEVQAILFEEYEKNVHMYYDINYIDHADEEATLTLWSYAISDIELIDEQPTEDNVDCLKFKIMIDDPNDEESYIEFIVTEKRQ